MRKYVKILGVKIDSTSYDGVLENIALSLKSKKKFVIFTVNPEILVASHRDSVYKSILNTSTISVADGIGVSIASSFLGKGILPLIPGRELMLKILSYANKNRLKICFLGGREEVNKKAVNRVLKDYPDIDILGLAGPLLDMNADPVTERDIKIDKDTIRDINLFGPHILFVAFGAPKQERWVCKHIQNLGIGGVMVIGGAIDYFAGEAKLPPKKMSDLHLEWLWRLYREPWRIKRIFNAIIVFPCLVVKERFRKND